MLIKTMVLLQSTKEEALTTPFDEGVADATVRKFSTSNSILELLGLVLILVIVLAATYFTTRFIGNYKLGQLKNSNFQVIDTYRLSQNKMLQIVKIGNKYIVIAIGKDQITYITELDETQVLTREMGIGDKQSFKQALDYFRNKK